MKKRFSKKALSLFLAVMMIITAVPAFSLTVSAASSDDYWKEFASSDFTASSNTSISFTTSGSGSNTTVVYTPGSDTATASSSDRAMQWTYAWWNGTSAVSGYTTGYSTSTGLYTPDGYVALTGYTDESGNSTTPITGLDKFKIDMLFEFASTTYGGNGSNTGFFKISAGDSISVNANDATAVSSNYYFGHCLNGTLYGNDSSSSTDAMYPDGSSIVANTKYHYIVTYDGENITVELKSEDYSTTITSATTTPNSSFTTDDIKAIRFGTSNDAFYKHLAFYNIKFYKYDDNLSGLTIDAAIAAFEDRLSTMSETGVAYTNLNDAYKIYDEAKRYIASCKYTTGKYDDSIIADYAEKLTEAINNMDEYKKPVSKYNEDATTYTDSTVTAGNLSTAIDKAYTNNLIYMPNLSSYVESYSGGGTSGDRGYYDKKVFTINDQNYVWVYTGDSDDRPTAPLISAFKYSSNVGFKASGISAIVSASDTTSTYSKTDSDFTSGGIRVEGSNWYFSSSSTPDWYYGISSYKDNCSNDQDTNISTGKSFSDSYQFGSNYIGFYYASSENTSTAVSSLTSFTPYYGFRTYWKSWGSGYKTQYNGDNGTIQVIDFRPVLNAISNKVKGNTVLENVENYSFSEMSALLSAIDAVTSKDWTLTSYSDYTTLITSVNSLIDTMTNVATPSTLITDNDVLGATVLANAETYAAAVAEKKDTTHTKTALENYKTAYETAYNYFVLLNPEGENKAFGTNGSDPTTYNTNLKAENTALSAATLADDDAYSNFDYVQSLISMLDLSAYTDNGSAIKTDSSKYGTSSTAGKDYDKTEDTAYVGYDSGVYRDATTTELDNYIKDLLEDMNTNKQTFTLTVNKYVDSTETVSSTTGAEKHTYGYTESITIPSNAVSVKVTRDDGSKSGSSSTYIDFTPGENYTVKVQSNTVVDIYTASSSASYVLLEDYAGRAQVIFTTATTATISGQTVTIDGTAYTTPSAGYVTFDGYTVDGTKATGSVKISSGSVIKAYGTKDANTVTYKVTGGTINNEEELTAKVDTSLTIKATSENCSAIAIKNSDDTYTAIAYGTTATFYGFPQAAVGDTVKIVCVDADDLSDKMPMSYGVGYATAGSPNVFSMYCLMSTGSYDKTATIVERGVLVSASESANTSDTLIKGADNVKTLKSSSDIDSQSYMATIKTSTSTIYARSYVAYTVTYEYNGTTYYLPVVAYGEVQTLTAAA